MKQGFLVFSPDLKGKPLSESKVNGLIQFLKSQDISYKTATGCYFGSTELSFVVGWTESNFELVLGLAKFFDQESILLVDSDSRTYLKFLNTNKEVELGQWTEIKTQDADQFDSYTVINGRVFTTMERTQNVASN